MLEGEGFSHLAKKNYFQEQVHFLSSSGFSTALFYDIPWPLHMNENWRDKRITIRGEQLTKMDINYQACLFQTTMMKDF